MEWKEEYGGTLFKTVKRMGASCDWDRTKFTMDEDYSNAATEVFIKNFIMMVSYIRVSAW